MTKAIKVLLQMTSVSLQPVPSLCNSIIDDSIYNRIILENIFSKFCHQVAHE
jgi:hypothetical protein